jgi:hypothetical protein
MTGNLHPSAKEYFLAQRTALSSVKAQGQLFSRIPQLWYKWSMHKSPTATGSIPEPWGDYLMLNSRVLLSHTAYLEVINLLQATCCI